MCEDCTTGGHKSTEQIQVSRSSYHPRKNKNKMVDWSCPDFFQGRCPRVYGHVSCLFRSSRDFRCLDNHGRNRLVFMLLRFGLDLLAHSVQTASVIAVNSSLFCFFFNSYARRSNNVRLQGRDDAASHRPARRNRGERGSKDRRNRAVPRDDGRGQHHDAAARRRLLVFGGAARESFRSGGELFVDL